MNSVLEPIFTSFRAYPNGANSLEQAIEKGFHYCALAVQQFTGAHGLMILPYNPGLWVDKSEKNIHYQLTMAHMDVAKGVVCALWGVTFHKHCLMADYYPQNVLF